MSNVLLEYIMCCYVQCRLFVLSIFMELLLTSFMYDSQGLVEYFVAELLRLMPEKFSSRDISHLPGQYMSALNRYANRRRNVGLDTGPVNSLKS